MMEWLSEWLKQIVLLVLIATFIDLLLPNHSMDRYVKLVMGLLITMAILSPILSLFTEELDITKLAFEKQGGSSADSMLPLSQIEEKSEKLKQQQSQLIQKQTESSMEKMISDALQQQFTVEVMKTNVITEISPEQVQKVKRIEVVAKVKEKESIPATSQEVQSAIQPIESVRIGGQIMTNQGSSQDETSQTAQLLVDFLTRTWHLEPDQVVVRVDPAW
ncbi:stage III sporulation protein AF [Hazenella coriacea]|uniref:Stage III sporulation protein AF n=2 Tax=Hazenella coriacea TaxID=1179467 RepID=A0A4R3L8N7_9BACL|nr:stage III sporulation protein AF [Hazenella coriacea]